MLAEGVGDHGHHTGNRILASRHSLQNAVTCAFQVATHCHSSHLRLVSLMPLLLDRPPAVRAQRPRTGSVARTGSLAPRTPLEGRQRSDFNANVDLSNSIA